MRVSPAFSSRRSVGLSAYTTTCLGNEVIGVDRVAERGPESSGEGSDISSKSFFSKLSFESLGISSELAHALRETGIEHPTSVQSNAIPAVCGGADVVIGAATGSGKTLAYLLPVLQMLKNEELFGNVERRSRRPRAVILVPTRELADQVRATHVARQETQKKNPTTLHRLCSSFLRSLSVSFVGFGVAHQGASRCKTAVPPL